MFNCFAGEESKTLKKYSMLKCKITGIFKYNLSGITDSGLKIRVDAEDVDKLKTGER